MRNFYFRNRSPLAVLMLVILLAGAWFFSRMQSALFPEITFPKIKIIADAGQQPVGKMMIAVTRPLENAIKKVPGLTTVRSTTSRGSCEISAFLDWNADINYSHTFYPTGSPFIQAANAHNASASLSLEKWLTTTANVDYAFGKTQDVFASLATSKVVSLGSLFNPNDVVSITPGIEITGGTRHFYETYITEKRLRDSLAGILLPPLLGGDDSETVSTTKTNTSFDLISYNFKLPLAYSRSSYQLEIAWQLSVINKKVTGSAQTNSFLTASFYYQF